MALTTRFPTKLTTHDPYFVQFNFYELENVITSIVQDTNPDAGTIAKVLEAIDKVDQSFDYETRADKLDDTIQLPLQQSIPEETKVTYSEKDMKDLTQITGLIGNVTDGDFSGALENLGGIAQSMGGGGGAMELARDAINNFQGRAINQQMQLFFDKPERRDYSFEFNLVARNKSDAEALQNIRRLLHYHASPGLSNTEAFYTYPSMVKFSFHKMFRRAGNESSEQIESLYESKYCYITGVNITHGGDKYVQFTDGTYSNTGIMKISLNLQEAEFFTRRDYEEGQV